jgi:hypothetical protein
MRIYFYADDTDIETLVGGLFQLPQVLLYKSSWIEGEKYYELLDAESSIRDILANEKLRMYFACRKETELRTKAIQLNTGQIKHSINHGVMPDTIRLLFGQQTDGMMLTVSTIDGFCETKLSKALFEFLKKLVVQFSEKQVGGVYIMLGAEKKYRSNWVLTPNREASKELHVVM